MLNIMVCTYLLSILFSIRYPCVHGGRCYKTAFVINGIFFPPQENGRVDLGVSATKVKPNHSLKMETVDPNPEEPCCETACAQGQTTTGRAFFVATLPLSFTHSVTPLHALASGCLEPPGAWGGGLVNFGWTRSGNYFLFGPLLFQSSWYLQPRVRMRHLTPRSNSLALPGHRCTSAH